MDFCEEFNSQNIHYQFSKNLNKAYLRAIYEWLETKIIILIKISGKPWVNVCNSCKGKSIYSVQILELGENCLS